MRIIKLNNPESDLESIKNLLEKNICFIGVFSKLCIHCKNMKPEWEKLKSRLKKINCNALLLEIDSNYLNNLENTQLSTINGFPSIVILKNNKIIKEYNGNRKANNMLNFFKPYIVLVNDKNKKTSKFKKSLKYNKSIKNKRTIKSKKSIHLCQHKKNGINGCTICCSKFKKRKTYKKCINKCMKN